jgi:hypothetical protein
MPRPMVVNAKRQPVPPLNLEEFKFWLRIMEEHALFIKAGLPCDNVALQGEADTFAQELAALGARADAIQSPRKFAELVADAQTVVGDFYRFKRQLLHLVLTCQLAGCNFALVLDHLSREAEYFLQLLGTLAGGQPLYQVTGAREVAFWLRLMADHADFISHRLDPSERPLVETADNFAGEFDELYLQGRDFVSMLRGETGEVPSFRRFLQDVRVSTLRLRDFKRAAEALAAECKLVGLVPPLWADHLRREADHFLLVLSILEKSTYVAPPGPDEELEHFDLEETAAAVIEPMPPATLQAEDLVEAAPLPTVFAPPPSYTAGASFEEEGYQGSQEAIYQEDEDYAEDEESPPPPLPPAPLSSPPPKQAKFKWSGKWPRPLGSLK